ncbi:hypothetical protein [Frankia gtarii]|uniref:hypothetical protein n=1 Tax=Frankia gtarii TaxID=2950102 RepID=UPI0021C0F001|nr:hypothetical protein [Frankia gtarii]
MTFVDRDYPSIVRDILTTLTGGVAAEAHRVRLDPDRALADIHLLRRPVARVTAVTAFLVDGDGAAIPLGLDDYQIVADARDAADLSTLRLLPAGRARLAPNANANIDIDIDIVVNYQPRTTDPPLVTDVAVGSVARTLVEAVAREIAGMYLQLNAAYDAAFLDTATGGSLDRVVALLGYSRYRAGRPVGAVRFSRRAGESGEITIAAGTPIADAADTLRYETTESRTMLTGESTARVSVRGATDTTPAVGTGVLTVIQRAIAGVDTVTNDAPTSTASQDENDTELRARVRVALAAAAKGTVAALTHGLLALPGVRAVNITEQPDDLPGEIEVSVSLTDPPADGSIPAAVINRIDELRPAGVRVRLARAEDVHLAARVQLVLAGGSVPMPAADRARLRAGATATLLDRVNKLRVGQRVRVGALQAALVDGDTILDAVVRIGPRGGEPGAAGADVTPGPGQVARLAAADVGFDDDQFDAPPAAVAVPIGVHAAARPAGPEVDPAALRAGVTARLTAYLATLTPGANVTAAAVLAAVRDDAAYALDPLGLVVTFAAGDQFVDVAVGGHTFTVAPGQRFTLLGVEVG